MRKHASRRRNEVGRSEPRTVSLRNPNFWDLLGLSYEQSVPYPTVSNGTWRVPITETGYQFIENSIRSCDSEDPVRIANACFERLMKIYLFMRSGYNWENLGFITDGQNIKCGKKWFHITGLIPNAMDMVLCGIDMEDSMQASFLAKQL